MLSFPAKTLALAMACALSTPLLAAPAAAPAAPSAATPAAASAATPATGPAAPASSSLSDRVLAQVDAGEAQVIAWRRHVHQHPELAYQEEKTAAYVADALRAMPGIEVQTGIASTGVKAVLRGGKPGPVVALRADMDALPVQERSGLSFASTAKGTWQGKEVPVSHACGHDAHVAMLLGAAQALSAVQADLPGTVVFLFQPAEEIGPGAERPSGALAMVEAGVLDNPKVDVVFGQHISAQGRSGAITYRPGAFLASIDVFNIKLTGKGGHGSSPWAASSPLLAAADTASALQNIVSHQTNPTIEGGATVVTVGMLQAGNRFNILPETAEIAGSVRALSEQNQKVAHEQIRRKAEHIAASHGVTAEVKIDTGGGYGQLVNDPATTRSIVSALHTAAGEANVREQLPSMGSEDFGAFGSTGIPVAFWFLHASPNGDKRGAPNHSPEFVIDEGAMKVGTRALSSAALSYLEGTAR